MLVTNGSGSIVESLDYTPFGRIRLDQRTTPFSESRKYIGQVYDQPTELQYLNARYYDPALGRFGSLDPLLRGAPESRFLEKPQALNYYSYSENNPINKLDPSGLYNVQSGKVDQTTDTYVSIANDLTAAFGPQYGVYFTADALLAFNGGKKPVYGQNYGYSIDLGNKYNVGGGVYQGGGFAESSAPIANALVFNGNSLNYYSQTNPSQNRSWSGVSGRAGYSPITEGVWGVDPSRTQQFFDEPLWKQLGSAWSTAIKYATFGYKEKSGPWPGGPIAWGYERTELSDKTRGVEYSTYYIHGGLIPGSAGCIDLTGNNDSFHSWLGSYGKPIDLYVNYK